MKKEDWPRTHMFASQDLRTGEVKWIPIFYPPHGYRIRYGEFPLPDFGVVREREEGEFLVVEDFFELRNVRGEPFGNIEPPLHRRILDTDVEHCVERPARGFRRGGGFRLRLDFRRLFGKRFRLLRLREGGCRHRERCDKVCLHKF